MIRKTSIYIQLMILLISFSCVAQPNETSLIKVENNEELKYVLTYLQPLDFIRHEDDKMHFFMNAYKLRGHSYILLNHEEHIQRKYFYFLISSFGEATHIEAQLFKTRELIDPVITKIMESEDNKQFLIYVSVIEPEEMKEDRNGNIIIDSENFKRKKDIVFKINKY